MKLDFNLLKVFVALYQERHTTRAGERLGITQSSVSNALRRLRIGFDDALFQKSPQGMEPTALAVTLAPEVLEIVERLETMVTARRSFDPTVATDTFLLGMTDQAAFAFGPPLIAALRREAPYTKTVLRIVDKDSAQHLMDEDQIHFAVGILPKDLPARIIRTVIGQEGFRVVMAPAHPLSQATPVSLEGYLSFPHLLVSPTGRLEGVADVALSKLDRSRSIEVVVPSLVAAGQILVQQNNLICTLSQSVADGLAAYFNLVCQPCPVSLTPGSTTLIFHQRWRDQPAHRWLRAIASHTCRQVLSPHQLPQTKVEAADAS
ncbi:LysR family transcriptional regulator [Mesorhizobium sp. CU3]|nr:LysR family transcriptional regulator [Mesorhizobium sp. CU3]